MRKVSSCVPTVERALRTEDGVHPDNIREECRCEKRYDGCGHEKHRWAVFD